MLVYPGMLIEAARKAGMKIPEDADKFDPKDFPHFSVFCNSQLCRPMRAGEHWDNAHVIAAIPNDEIFTVTLADLIRKGLSFQT